MKAFISLGSNLDERAALLSEAAERLRALADDHQLCVSHVYETRPWGRPDQPDYLNAVVAFETESKPLALLSECQRIERSMGRTDGGRWGPRRIDLDLLDVGGLTIETEDLSLPHPRIAQRAFVLIPICEIAPDWADPRTGSSAVELLTVLNPEPSEVRLVGPLATRGESRCQQRTIRPF